MPKQRQTAVEARRSKYGRANQMGHEVSEKVERDAMRAKMAEGRAARKAEGARRMKAKTREKGMNSGTMGGSRSALARAFFSNSRDRGRSA